MRSKNTFRTLFVFNNYQAVVISQDRRRSVNVMTGHSHVYIGGWGTETIRRFAKSEECNIIVWQKA